MRRAGLTRRRLILVGGSAATAVLAACAGAIPAAPKPTSAPPSPIRYMDRAEPRYQKFVEEWLKGLAAKSSRVKVQYEPIPVDWEQKLTAELAAGTAPDVAAVYGHWFRAYMEKGQIVDLTPYVAKELRPEDTADFFQGQWRGMSLEGRQLAIPQYININGLFVNKDAAREVGAAIPAVPYTHDQLLQLATRLQKKVGEKVERYGFATGWAFDGFIRIISLIWGLGGEINPADDLTKFAFTKPETVRAFQWVHDLAFKHKVGAVTNADLGGVGAPEAFFAGRLGSLLEGAQLASLAPDTPKIEWDILPPPRVQLPAQRSSMDGYVISRTARAPDLAWEVIKESTSAETMKLRARLAMLTPARKSAVSAWTEAFPNKNVKALVDTMDQARPDPRSLWKNGAAIWNALRPTMEELFVRNRISVDDAMTRMQAAAERVVREG